MKSRVELSFWEVAKYFQDLTEITTGRKQGQDLLLKLRFAAENKNKLVGNIKVYFSAHSSKSDLEKFGVNDSFHRWGTWVWDLESNHTWEEDWRLGLIPALLTLTQASINISETNDDVRFDWKNDW